MGSIRMTVSITYFDHGLEEFCRFYEIVDDNPCTSRKLTLEEAQRLAWELKLAGGERNYRTNYRCNHIHTVEVTYTARR